MTKTPSKKEINDFILIYQKRRRILKEREKQLERDLRAMTDKRFDVYYKIKNKHKND